MPEDDIRISRKVLVSLVGRLVHGYPNPEDDSPVGPWGPVIRRALERVRWTAGPEPDPWRRVALNPQPLPPRLALAVALADAVIDKTTALHEIEEVLPEEAQGGAHRAASGFLARFIDDCGNGRIPPWKRWPGPWPPRSEEFAEPINAFEMVVMGAQFAQAASLMEHQELQSDLSEAGARLMEQGLSQM